MVSVLCFVACARVALDVGFKLRAMYVVRIADTIPPFCFVMYFGNVVGSHRKISVDTAEAEFNESDGEPIREFESMAEMSGGALHALRLREKCCSPPTGRGTRLSLHASIVRMRGARFEQANQRVSQWRKKEGCLASREWESVTLRR